MWLRIEHFFEHERIEPSSFFMTQRIEPFLKILWLQDLKLLWIGRWNFLNLDQGIEAFSTISLKNDWPFLDMTLRVEPFFNMTHRIEPFLKTWFIEIEPFFTTWLENESFFSMTSRIFLQNVWLNSTDRFWKIWLKELKFFKEKRTLRIEPFSKIYFKNCTFLFWKKRSKNCLLLRNITRWIEFFFNITQRLEPFFSQYDLQELNLFEKYDSKDWTLLFNMTQRIEPFFEHDSQKLSEL